MTCPKSPEQSRAFLDSNRATTSSSRISSPSTHRLRLYVLVCSIESQHIMNSGSPCQDLPRSERARAKAAMYIHIGLAGYGGQATTVGDLHSPTCIRGQAGTTCNRQLERGLQAEAYQWSRVGFSSVLICRRTRLRSSTGKDLRTNSLHT